MSKRKDRAHSRQLFQSVVEISSASSSRASQNDEAEGAHGNAPIADDILAASQDLRGVLVSRTDSRRELMKMKKFRFQLLHQWMMGHIAPCRAADIGGGKGLLSYLLNQSGWQATVIDPVHQELPTKYKELSTDKQLRIAAEEKVPRLDRPFAPEMAQEFDLLVALHAHGCNIQAIDAAARFGCGFLLLPCCIIDEPIVPPPGTHWLQCVADYAKGKGFVIEPFQLNFKGQNIGLYGRSCATE